MADLELQKVYRPPAGRAVEAPWGEEVARSIAQKFATVTERDARWTTPPAGAICSTTDTDQLWYHNRTAGAAGWEEVAQLDKHVGPGGIKLPIAGGTMTGQLSVGSRTDDVTFSSYGYFVLHAQSDAPYIDFQSKAATPVRFGYLQYTSTYGQLVTAGGGSQYFRFLFGKGLTPEQYVETFRADNAGAMTFGRHDVSGNVRGGSVWSESGMRSFAAAGSCLALIGTSQRAYVGFYASGTNVDSIGTRTGYIGYPDSGYLYITNEAANSSIILRTDFATAFHCGTTPAEVMRIQLGYVMIGKSSSNLDLVGCEIHESGSHYVTRTAASGALMYMNRPNGVDENFFIGFYRGDTANVGSIRQEGTTGCKLVSGSDRRMKNIVGPITNAIERVKAMKPYRVTWIDDPSRGETDAFIADEMMSIVPEAVTGQPNAVAGPPVNEGDPPEGTPLMQGMSYEKLMTVTIAALQNVIGRVEALEAA